ncbi:non-canonical purine NTP pyrophosphatase [Iodidimonas nitroreducens]|uniref:dITP/XTP pyrophosphatase n=1 Tax=Iodidimonas nitroreducens TaxID=1236968 RepID=A0A5A7N635_9PROT|nr:RdgB/HAM1 family non-canonical purine NTP pyrophosphatase [Iodidimonas nitroreducens]GAK34796.1 non-canonical purine NTP pyrophosphatase [alpha proteobacterium Q-1]GER02486.1 non-canonical purine NTP pyrophosphatase [Iodidimonas nitroreducens]
MTARRFSGDRLVLASHNAGKVREIKLLLAPLGIKVLAAGDLGLDEPEETGTSFIANAELKALAAAKASDLPALSDDSGLVVHGLLGAPGIYSARWAGPEKDFGHAMNLIAEKLDGADSTAHFICALSLAWPDGHRESVEGRIDGHLCFPPRGTRGFGYDPIFVPDGYDLSFGEMDPDHKAAINHRADAFRQMLERCFDRSA